MSLAPNTVRILCALGCLVTACSATQPGSAESSDGNSDGDSDGDGDPLEFPYQNCAEQWQLPGPPGGSVPLPNLDPSDAEGPRIESVVRVDPGGTRLAISWSEPLVNPEAIDPDDFRFAHRGWGTGKLYGPPEYTLVEQQAIAVIPDPTRRDRVEVELSSPLPFQPRCSVGCGSTSDPYGSFCSAPTAHFRPGSSPPTDVNGNEAQPLYDWIFDASLPAEYGSPSDGDFLAVDRCSGIPQMTLLNEEVLDDRTLRLTFSEPVANACDLDLAQFHLTLRESYDFDCDCNSLGDCYFDPSGCADFGLDHIDIVAAANDPAAATGILLRTTGGLACSNWHREPFSGACDFVATTGTSIRTAIPWSDDPNMPGRIRGRDGEFVVPADDNCLQRGDATAVCMPN